MFEHDKQPFSPLFSGIQDGSLAQSDGRARSRKQRCTVGSSRDRANDYSQSSSKASSLMDAGLGVCEINAPSLDPPWERFRPVEHSGTLGSVWLCRCRADCAAAGCCHGRESLDCIGRALLDQLRTSVLATDARSETPAEIRELDRRSSSKHCTCTLARVYERTVEPRVNAG